MSQEELEKIECPKCFKGTMEVRRGRFGMFMGCSRYPKCRCTRRLEGKSHEEAVEGKCPKCNDSLHIRNGKWGPYIACVRYPDNCDHTAVIREKTGIKCPLECGGDVVYIANKHRKRKSRNLPKGFYGCTNYPECVFGTWARPTDRKCPKCEFVVVEHWEFGNQIGFICAANARNRGNDKMSRARIAEHGKCDWKEDLPDVDED